MLFLNRTQISNKRLTMRLRCEKVLPSCWPLPKTRPKNWRQPRISLPPTLALSATWENCRNVLLLRWWAKICKYFWQDKYNSVGKEVHGNENRYTLPFKKNVTRCLGSFCYSRMNKEKLIFKEIINCCITWVTFVLWIKC